MKIATAQLTADRNKDVNLAKAVKYIAKAKESGADLIVFPEIFMAFVPARATTYLADVAEPLDGNFVTRMKEAARKHQINIIFGMYETKPGEKERAYNTIVFLDRSGNLVKSYQKTHLYDAFTTKESNRVIPGDASFGVVETDFGTIGLMICYELRFPEIARSLVLQGADILIIPTAWVTGDMKEFHWKTLLKARAIENTVFVVGANQIGNIYSGSSTTIDPMGVEIASAGEEEILIIAEVDLERIKRVRAKLPCIENRRPEFYYK
ncbi:carbon-nitrogen hydrolase family protein [Neobacillus mesonae]|uniref:carbon-nitrogen hydrolase family protein n=1 Tax=Neobacillus mesonae TaxID=1193713 RepID=UPI00203A9E21|nr:carbon-nitrogen hydrolase family protein [Neobacillus mesonae]MCM3569358.1 carbon-nitrogen hydrolase family protein [Neobacillus mesonae]